MGYPEAMEQHGPIAALIDATGGGACRLDEANRVVSCSRGFARLVGLEGDGTGVMLAEAVPALPKLEEMPGRVGESSASFAQIGSDGVRRQLAPARIEIDGEPWVVVVDRSREDKLARKQAQLGREIDDLKGELKARARAPAGPRVRTMRELAARLDEAMQRATRYKHEVTVVHVRCGESPGADPAEILLACVRGVDDVGAAGEGSYAILLPHTDLPGGDVVAKRIVGKLRDNGIDGAAVGVAQAHEGEKADGLAARADGACKQAHGQGGGVLLAVDVL
jgi:GGDEF domain-containing protein